MATPILTVNVGVVTIARCLAGWLIYRAANPSAPFSNSSLTNLTTTGNVQRVALSPAGKYAVYGVGDKLPLSSLRITQLATGTTNTILEPEPVRYLALTVSPDGRIVFDSEAGNTKSISIMNADGSQQRLLTEGADKRAIIGYASATADGRYILYHSDQSGTRQIWRMNLDGSNPIQLTHGKGADHPAASPDSQWVVFTQQEQAGDGKPTLWKVSINGGEPTRLTNDFTVYPSVSPDGKMVACLYSPTTKDPGQPAIYSFPEGKLLKVFPQAVRAAPYIRWSPDGQSLV